MSEKGLDFSGKRCLVLGGKGFIGTHLVYRLLEMGCNVRVFDRPACGLDDVTDFKDSVEIYEGDFINETHLTEALEGVDYVFHLISTTTPKTSSDNPIYDVETNLVGSLKLLEIIKKWKDIKLIFISSGGTVYGIPERCPIPEEHLPKPICPYGVNKLTIENYLHNYNYLYGLDYVVLRVSNPYGEKQNPKSIQGAIPVFMYKILEGNEITIWGDGSVTRDFIYIEDVVDALIISMCKESKKRIFNVGSGVGTSLNDLIRTMAAVTGQLPHVEYLPGRNLDVPINYLDISLARSELGWAPKTSLDKGLEKTWAWLRSQYSNKELL